MFRFATAGVGLLVISLGGCASFAPKEPPMASKQGVVPGATSQELLRAPQATSGSKEYVIGADNLPSNVVVKTEGTGGSLNYFLTAVEVSVPNKDEAAVQMAADLSDNLGMPARVEGDVIIMDGLPDNRPSLSFGSTGIEPVEVKDCYLKLGNCRTILTMADGVEMPVLVETGHQFGLWYQTVRIDTRRSRTRGKVLSKAVFSVDSSGALKDMNTVSYVGRKPVQKFVRRVE